MRQGLVVVMGLVSVCAQAQTLERGKEYQCNLVATQFIVNGAVQNKNKAATNEKPVYHVFDGRILRAYYKESGAPSISYDGARFISSKTVSESGRTFEVMKFELTSKMKHRIEFFAEKTANAARQINLAAQFSGNDFVSYGEYISVCK